MDPVALRARLEAAKAKAADSGIPYCPHKPSERQAAFLAIEAKEAFYGGAAGGGKSDALLMDTLKFAGKPGYHALILRRTLTDLALPGAIMDRFKSWIIGRSGVRWNERDKLATFDSGARVQFGFCETEDDVYRYQGAEFHLIAIDELTQWSEKQYLYLTSRLRRKAADNLPIRMRGAGNPGGIGHRWVKERFVYPGSPERPFVPALAKDNPALNVSEYEETLSLLDATTKAQLLHGEWVESNTGRVYSYTSTKNAVQDTPPMDGWHTVLAVDLGASEIKPSTAFTIVRWHQDVPTAYCVKSWAEAGMTPTTSAERIKAVMQAHPRTRIVMDVGALGVGYANEMRQRYGIPVEAAQKRDKQGYRRLMNGAFERGELLVLAPECAMLVSELEDLQWHKNGKDDDPGSSPNHCSDALLYAWRAAQSWRSVYYRPEPVLSEADEWERRDRENYWKRKADPWNDW